MRTAGTTPFLLALLAATVLGGMSSPARAAPPLTVFGDSYSVPFHDRTRDWPVQLRNAHVVGRINDFAEFGATAITRHGPDFADEIREWDHAGQPLGATVVYLGFNDIGGNMAGARAGYT